MTSAVDATAGQWGAALFDFEARAAQTLTRVRASKGIVATGPSDTPSKPSIAPPAAEDRNLDASTRDGLTIAKTARDEVERLSSMVREFNSAKGVVDDPSKLDFVRENYGEKAAERHLEMARKTMESSKNDIAGMQQRMSQLYTITGNPVSSGENGYLAHGDYSLGKSRSGWTMSVASNGAASVLANGTDVSSLVDNQKINGERWNVAGNTVDLFA